MRSTTTPSSTVRKEPSLAVDGEIMFITTTMRTVILLYTLMSVECTHNMTAVIR